MAKTANFNGVVVTHKAQAIQLSKICWYSGFSCLRSRAAERSAQEFNGQVSSSNETAFDSELYKTISGR